MSTINKILTGFLYDGALLALASAPWKNNVRAIYGFNAAGTAYQVFKPGNRFNSLTELRQDGSYTLEAATTGFELPGATLAVVPAGPTGPASPGPLSFEMLQARRVVGYQGADMLELVVKVRSTDPADEVFLLDTGNGNLVSTIPVNSPSGYGFLSPPTGSTHTVTAVNLAGNVLRGTYTVPAP